MSMSKHNNSVPHGVPHGIPHGVVIDNKHLGSYYMTEEYDVNTKFLKILPFVCAVFQNPLVTFVRNKGQIKVELPPESGFSFLSIADYDKHRVTMACVKKTNPGEPYGIAELADTPMDCSTFEEMVGDMLFHITSVKLGTADLFTEWYDE